MRIRQIAPMLVAFLGLWYVVNIACPVDAFGDDPPSNGPVMVQTAAPADSDAIVMMRLLSSFGPTGVIAAMALFARGWQPTLRIVVAVDKPLPVRIVTTTTKHDDPEGEAS